jgi:hypothetical protein
MEAAIDSGSPSGFALPKRYAEQLPLAHKPLLEVGRGRMANSEFVLSSATVDVTARIGINSFQRPVVTFNDVLPGALFGVQVLRNMVLTIDQKNRASGSRLLCLHLLRKWLRLWSATMPDDSAFARSP